MKFYTAFLLTLFTFMLNAQQSTKVQGKVIDALTRAPLPFATVYIEGTSVGSYTDENGLFTIDNVTPGYIKLVTSFVGYESTISDDYYVTFEKIPFITVLLQPNNNSLDEVVVAAKLFKKSVTTPLSTQKIGVTEIEKNPGGNRDVLKVIQSFPGVSSGVSFRNDFVVRGGAPSENKFYLDGVEIPVINHFQTQGATGGPVGIINTDLIRSVEFTSSAFPASRGNMLSSYIEFTQKEGNASRINTRATLGTSDAGLTIDGPLTKNTTLIASVRQSYLKFLFELIKLPFLPTYNDFQLKTKTSFSNSDLTIVAIGAIDNFELNKNVNDDVTDIETLKRNTYILNNIPVQEQWNYTVGAVYKEYNNSSERRYILSRNVWNNEAVKYVNNVEDSQNLLLNYSSKEIENKFRFENSFTVNSNSNMLIGAGLENGIYTNSTYQNTANSIENYIIDFSSRLELIKYNLFSQFNVSKPNYNFTIGIRLDATDFNSEMKNIFNQFSPRTAFSYLFSDKFNATISAGRYFQLPAYTILGYRDENNRLINKENDVTYIRSDHFVSGVEFFPNSSLKISLEGFYKKYNYYPFSVRDQISLANLGSDFGVVGNEEVTSSSEGRSYGLEFFVQQKPINGFYTIFSYTLVRSEFNNGSQGYIPSSWDNEHLLTITTGKKLKKDWEIGAKFRLIGGQPYTPYDMEASSLIQNYNVTNSGILDYSKINAERFSTFHQLDIRIDKTWFWKSMALNFYFDIQNVYNSTQIAQPFLLPFQDSSGSNIINPNDSSRYLLEEVTNENGTVLPRFGIIVDF